MKNFLLTLFLLLPLCAWGQDTGWNLTAYGGVSYSGNENSKFEEPYELINGIVGASVGYDINYLWGCRTILTYGSDTSSSNIKESHRDYSDFYSLKDISAFIDGTLNLTYLFTKRSDRRFNVDAYCGLGVAFTWGYEDVKLNWYNITDVNQYSLGIQGGALGEYRISNRLGAVFDISVTGYQDNFNGVDAGVMFDTKTCALCGLRYYF